MSAYLIADLVVKDRETFSGYASQVPDIIAKYGGKFIVRGGELEKVEGDWDINRLVILEFPDKAALRRFWDSEDYQAILPLRVTATDSRIIFVDGV